MDTKERNDNILVQTVKRVVLDVLKDEPTLRLQADGACCYEIAPIPGDCLSSAEMQRINTEAPMNELLAIIGGKYYDVISAAEQALYQYCFAKVRDVIPDAAQSDVMEILGGMVRIDPPIQYYLKQLRSAGEQQ